VLSPGVRVHSWSEVDRAVLLDNAVVGRGAVVRDAILDKFVHVPPGARVGVDKDHDRARGYTVSAQGITVVGKGITVTD
jgi:glucose-1-phosphate adenylyltransferase